MIAVEEPCRGCRAFVDPVQLPTGPSVRRVEQSPAGYCFLCSTLHTMAGRSIALALGEGVEPDERAMPTVVRACLRGAPAVEAYQAAVRELLEVELAQRQADGPAN